MKSIISIFRRSTVARICIVEIKKRARNREREREIRWKKMAKLFWKENEAIVILWKIEERRNGSRSAARERLSFFRFAVDAEAARFNEHRNVPLLLPSLATGFFHPSLFFPFARFRFFHRFAEFPGILHRGFVSRVFLLPKERSFSFLSFSYHLPYPPSFSYPRSSNCPINRLNID